jgi:hypothetical protein
MAKNDVVTIRIPPGDFRSDQPQQQYGGPYLEDVLDRYTRDYNDMQRQLAAVGGAQASLQTQLVSIGGAQVDIQRQLTTGSWVQAGLFAMQAALLASILFVGVRQLSAMRRFWVSANRPAIRVRHLWLAGEMQPGLPVSASLVIANIGAAIAHIRSCEVTGLVVPMEATLPARPWFPKRTLDEAAEAGERPEPRRGHVDPGSTLEISCPGIIDRLTEAEYDQLMANRALLTCYGSIEYLDEEQRTRTTNFCRCLRFYHGAANQPIGRFSLVNDPDYEYQD